MGYGLKSGVASTGLASAVAEVDALVRSMFSYTSYLDDQHVSLIRTDRTHVQSLLRSSPRPVQHIEQCPTDSTLQARKEGIDIPFVFVERWREKGIVEIC